MKRGMSKYGVRMILKYDVVFLVEHKDRELESVEAIASELKKRGVSSIVVSIHFHMHYLLFCRPKAVVFPYLLRRDDWPTVLAYQLYGDRAGYVNMNWEQLISKLNEAYKSPRDNFVKRKVKHLAWSEHFKSYLVSYGVKEENVCITGNPATTILRRLLPSQEKWRRTLAEMFSLDMRKPWFFFPMNYGWAFLSDAQIKAKIANGYPSDLAWEHRAYAQRSLQAFIPFVKEIYAKGEYEVIVRPHPSIPESAYRELLKGDGDGIVVSKAFSIREWIVASDMVGSSWSTAVWDAYQAGKRVFLFTPYERPEWLNVWWNDLVPNIRKTDEISNLTRAEACLPAYDAVGAAGECIADVANAHTRVSPPKIGGLKASHWMKIVRSLLRQWRVIGSGALIYDRFEVKRYG